MRRYFIKTVNVRYLKDYWRYIQKIYPDDMYILTRKNVLFLYTPQKQKKISTRAVYIHERISIISPK